MNAISVFFFCLTDLAAPPSEALRTKTFLETTPSQSRSRSYFRAIGSELCENKLHNWGPRGKWH